MAASSVTNKLLVYLLKFNESDVSISVFISMVVF